MPPISAKTLDQHHPSYNSKRLCQLRALYEGGEAWHALKRTWIPRNYKEPIDLYEDRLNRATYTNHSSPIIDLISAWLFEAPPALSDEATLAIKALEDNADGKGTPLPSLLQEVFIDALVGGKAFVWVNLPKRDEQNMATTLFEEESKGLNQPFLVRLPPEQVIDWEEDDRGDLQWIMVHDMQQTRSDPTQGGRQVAFRWTLITKTSIRRWVYVSEDGQPPGEHVLVPEQLTLEHNIGTLPVKRIQLAPGLWAMEKLHDPAIDLARKDNDLAWALHKSAHALMVILRGGGIVLENTDITVGPGYSLELESEADVKYVEPSGSSFGVLRQAKQDAKSDLYRVVHQMALSGEAGNATQAVSGASKSRDWESLQVIMSAYSRLVLDFVTELLKLVGTVAGKEAPGLRVGGLNAWRKRTLEQFLEAAALTLGAQTMSPTFAREVAKEQAWALLGESSKPEVMKAIEDEIDQADPLGANITTMGKQLGDDVFSDTGVRDKVEKTDQYKKDQQESQPDQ